MSPVTELFPLFADLVLHADERLHQERQLAVERRLEDPSFFLDPKGCSCELCREVSAHRRILLLFSVSSIAQLVQSPICKWIELMP